jgi:hypothetical protein
MGKKIPIAASVGAIVSGEEIWAAYKQNGLNGAMYHASGYDMNAKTFAWQAAFNTWKPALVGGLITYAAQKVGASKITNKVPLIGQFFKV